METGRRARLRGWGCGRGTEGSPSPGGQDVAQPARSLGPCRPLQAFGGTALSGVDGQGPALAANTSSQGTPLLQLSFACPFIRES